MGEVQGPINCLIRALSTRDRDLSWEAKGGSFTSRFDYDFITRKEEDYLWIEGSLWVVMIGFECSHFEREGEGSRMDSLTQLHGHEGQGEEQKGVYGEWTMVFVKNFQILINPWIRCYNMMYIW